MEIITLIATCNRAELLNTRSLPSVIKQTRLPDRIIIIDDSLPENRRGNRKVCEDSIPTHLPWDYMINTTLHGHAFSWNLGLKYISENYPDAWVAILDDDDEWNPGHLLECEKHVAPETNCVVSGLQTILNDEELPFQFIKELSIKDFLRGNPGW